MTYIMVIMVFTSKVQIALSQEACSSGTTVLVSGPNPFTG